MAEILPRSLLEEMSTEQLDQLLREYTESADDGNEDICFAILDIIEQREKKSSTCRLPDVDKAWEEFQNYYLTSDETLYPLDEVVQPEASTSDKKRKNIRLHRILIAAALVAVLATLLIPPAFGYQNVFQMIGRWTDDTFRFVQRQAEIVSTDNAKSTEMPEFAENLLPTWVPEGYTLSDKPTLVQNDYYQKICYQYVNEQGHPLKYAITIYDKPEDSALMIAEKNAQSMETYVSNEKVYYIMHNGVEAESVTAICSDGRVVIIITGETLSVATAKSIIDSIGGRFS